MTIETRENITKKLKLLVDAFNDILYMNDEAFMENMKANSLAGDNIEKYKHWEWPQGVGLFGIWKLFEKTKDDIYLNQLKRYYDRQLAIGLPSLNVNTIAPLLALSYLAEYTCDNKYLGLCKSSAEWIMESFPRTKEGGFQHITSDSINSEELWDDTLFMTVLFLANIGRILKNKAYIDEAEFQFLLHIKYLQDNETSLFFHGWTFKGNHNFANALWARGNCWLTIAIPEFIEIADCKGSVKKYLISSLNSQIKALECYQNENGMWHTLLNDFDAYVESSATAGFGYGILKAVNTDLIPKEKVALAEKAIYPILNYIDNDGIVSQVSYGTPMGRESVEFYKNIEIRPMPYGQALAMLFLIEFLDQEV